jgi:hypothetical protein
MYISVKDLILGFEKFVEFDCNSHASNRENESSYNHSESGK